MIEHFSFFLVEKSFQKKLIVVFLEKSMIFRENQVFVDKIHQFCKGNFDFATKIWFFSTFFWTKQNIFQTRPDVFMGVLRTQNIHLLTGKLSKNFPFFIFFDTDGRGWSRFTKKVVMCNYFLFDVAPVEMHVFRTQINIILRQNSSFLRFND